MTFSLNDWVSSTVALWDSFHEKYQVHLCAEHTLEHFQQNAVAIKRGDIMAAISGVPRVGDGGARG